MMKRNVIIHTAIASALLAMAASAQATTVSTVATAPIFAKELLQGTTPLVTALTIPAANAIVVTANTSIPAGSTVRVYVKLNGASISNIPSVAPGINSATVAQADGTGAGGAGVSIALNASSLGTTTGTANPAAVGAGVDYIVFTLNTIATPIGVGGVIATIGGVATGAGATAPLIVNNATALLTAPLTVTASVGVGAPIARFGALAASASNYDTTSAAANIATSAQGITLTAVANSNAGLIDLTATPVGSQFAGAVSTILAQLGSFTATNGTAVQADGASAYNMVSQAAATGLNLTVAAPAGFFAALETAGKLSFDSSATCATGIAGVNGMTSAAFGTKALAAAATSIAVPSTALPTSATPYYLCMYLPAHTATSTALIAGQPTLAGTITHSSTAIDSNTVLAATNMWPLALNGAQVDVLNYIPSAVTGYIQTVRLINTGAISAQASVAVINEATGVVGTAVPVGASIPAGGSLRLSQAQIETAIGAQAATVRPRLRFTAPTNGLKAQSLFNNANGAYTNLSGIEQ